VSYLTGGVDGAMNQVVLTALRHQLGRHVARRLKQFMLSISTLDYAMLTVNPLTPAVAKWVQL